MNDRDGTACATPCCHKYELCTTFSSVGSRNATMTLFLLLLLLLKRKEKTTVIVSAVQHAVAVCQAYLMRSAAGSVRSFLWVSRRKATRSERCAAGRAAYQLPGISARPHLNIQLFADVVLGPVLRSPVAVPVPGGGETYATAVCGAPADQA